MVALVIVLSNKIKGLVDVDLILLKLEFSIIMLVLYCIQNPPTLAPVMPSKLLFFIVKLFP